MKVTEPLPPPGGRAALSEPNGRLPYQYASFVCVILHACNGVMAPLIFPNWADRSRLELFCDLPVKSGIKGGYKQRKGEAALMRPLLQYTAKPLPKSQ